MKTNLFRRQLGILFLVTLAFAGVALVASHYATQAFMEWSAKEREKEVIAAPVARFANLVDSLAEGGKLSLDEIAERMRASGGGPASDLSVLSEEEVLTKYGLLAKELPSASAGSASVPTSVPADDGGFPKAFVFRSKAEPDKFLVFERPRFDKERAGFPGGPRPPGPRPPGMRGPPGPPLFLISFAVLILSGFFAAALSLFFLFARMRKKAQGASEVISAIKAGDWQRRMPIDRLDEVGHLMQEFNRMADEIEAAVKAMKQAESSRTSLLQQLAHDLRTPVAGLRSLIETLEMRFDSLKPEARAELFSMADREIEYFARLVEDLLFLAQVQDPRYRDAVDRVDIGKVMSEEIDRLKVGIEVDWIGPRKDLVVHGEPTLLKRLFRNGLENAASFAKSRVDVMARLSNGKIVVTISDDGPGFSPEALQSFGEKRFSRLVDSQQGGRVSVGLGSVIMATVVAAHGGRISIRNIEREGQIAGGEVSIELPQRNLLSH